MRNAFLSLFLGFLGLLGIIVLIFIYSSKLGVKLPLM